MGWLSIAFLLVAAACASETLAPLPQPSEANTLVVLPDTQFYACAYSEIFEQQTSWVAEQRAARKIGLVVHTGDIVDADTPAQWRVAAESFKQLERVVPYLVTTGNHDLSAGRASLASRYFDPSGARAFDLEAGSYEPDRPDNSYAVVRLGGRDWLVLGLEFGPRDRVLDWADDVLSEHAGLPAILFTHAYLYSDGRRYDRRLAPRQPYHPDDYALTPEQGINDGEDLWTKLIVPHSNIRLVLSGHVIPDGVAHASQRRATGQRVHQLLANYQHCDVCPCPEVEGGGGYLRLLEFGPNAIQVSTYSPHYDTWLRDADNEFGLPLEEAEE